MIVAAAACPQPPLLVPELAGGAAPDLAAVRSACDAAVAGLLAARPDEVLVVGTGARRHWWAPADFGTFAGYGLDLTVGFGDRTGDRFDDASMLLGAWLLARSANPAPRASGYTVTADTPGGECVALGRQLAERGARRRIALLAMGDGAARRAIGAPGVADPEADEFDRRALAALGSGDPAVLREVDAGLGTAVHAAGRASWQILAGALAPHRWSAEVTYSGTPREVTYLVSLWRPRCG